MDRAGAGIAGGVPAGTGVSGRVRLEEEVNELA